MMMKGESTNRQVKVYGRYLGLRQDFWMLQFTTSSIRVNPPCTTCHHKAMLPVITPAPLTSLKLPIDHPNWLYELKHDGFRGVLYVDP